MENQIATIEDEYKISPEALEVAKTYLTCHDTSETANLLGIETERVSYYLRKPDVKRFIDNLFLEQGYMNQAKMQEVMDMLFVQKLEEMEEAETGTSKDILDILTLQHKMRMEYLKEVKEMNPINVKQVNNIQQNGPFGDNYNDLVGKLIQAGSE